MALYYVDASALVKLVRAEPETEVLRRFLTDAGLVASELVLTEVPRAIRRACSRDRRLPMRPLVDRAIQVMETIALLPVDRALLVAAGALEEPSLRALDAIHIMAAVDASPVDAFVSYDERQLAAARLVGLPTIAPGV